MCRVDNSFTAHADNRKKYILILGKYPADRLGDSTITAEGEYSILVKNKVAQATITMEETVFLFVNGVKIYQYKAKDFEKDVYPFCLGNFSTI